MVTAHVEEVDGGGFRCLVCSKTVKLKDAAVRHVKMQHLQSTTEPVSCQYCGKTLKHKWALGDHIRRIHGLSSKNR